MGYELRVPIFTGNMTNCVLAIMNMFRKKYRTTCSYTPVVGVYCQSMTMRQNSTKANINDAQVIT